MEKSSSTIFVERLVVRFIPVRMHVLASVNRGLKAWARASQTNKRALYGVCEAFAVLEKQSVREETVQCYEGFLKEKKK
jgi:membrane protein required for beta-lactamase induction